MGAEQSAEEKKNKLIDLINTNQNTNCSIIKININKNIANYFVVININNNNINFTFEKSNDTFLLLTASKDGGETISFSKTDNIYAGSSLITIFNETEIDIIKCEKKLGNTNPPNQLCNKRYMLSALILIMVPEIKGGAPSIRTPYEKRTLTQLRSLAKSRKIVNYKKLTKPELIQKLRR